MSNLDFKKGERFDAATEWLYQQKIKELKSRVECLESALENTLSRYVQIVESGDCGFWDADTEPHVISARAALAARERQT